MAPALGFEDLTIDVIENTSSDCQSSSLDLKASFDELHGDSLAGISSLHFNDVCIVLTKCKRRILDQCTACFDSGAVTAIMGPSGAGKSTLLDCLGQRIHVVRSRLLEVSGTIYLNNHVMTPRLFRVRCAYVPQHDALWSTLTVREHFLFSVAFSNGKYMTHIPLVSKLIEVLGLSACADTMVGGHMVKGCSGGQQRRTSIGIEILSRPDVLLLDEPTTGLDAVAALKIVHMLQYLAKAIQVTVANTIHQPSSYIWEAFDNVLLLSGGQVAYQGSPHHVLAHMSKLGHVPGHDNINTADFILALVCIDFEDPTHPEQTAKRRLDQIISGWRTTGKSVPCIVPRDEELVAAKSIANNVGIFTITTLITRRMIFAILKDPVQLKARLAMTVAFGVFFGVMNSNISYSQKNVLGWLIVAVFEGGYLPMLSILLIPSFFVDAHIVGKEIGNGLYGAKAYWLANSALQCICSTLFSFSFLVPVFWLTHQTDLAGFFVALAAVSLAVILYDGVASYFGLLCSHYVLGMGLCSTVILLQWLFNGFFISLGNMPLWLRWLHWCSPMKYVHELLLVATFSYYDFGTCRLWEPCFNTQAENPFEVAASGADILKSLGSKIRGYPDYKVDDINVPQHVATLVLFIGSFRFGFLITCRRVLVA